MADLATSANAWIATKKAEWDYLVDTAIALHPKQIDRAASRLASRANVGAPTMRKKIEAIRFKAQQGWDVETIKREGQEATISAFVKSKVKARTEPLVNFPHRLTPPVRDALKSNCLRLAKLLGLKTWDEVFQYINSQIELASDLDHLHAAGLLPLRDGRGWTMPHVWKEKRAQNERKTQRPVD